MKSEIKIALAVLMIGTVTVIGSACAPKPAVPEVPVPAKTLVYHMKYASPYPPTHLLSDSARRICKEVYEESEGRILIDYFPAGQLGTAKELPWLADSGKIDFAGLTDQYYPDLVPVGQIYSLPGLFADWGPKWLEVLDTVVYDDRVNDKLFAGYEENLNLKYLGGGHYGAGFRLWGRDLYKTPADCKGTVLRCTGILTGELFESIGAGAYWCSASDVYIAYQRGTVDGSAIQLSSGYSYKWHELGGHINMVVLVSGPATVVMNRTKYESLPEDLQKLVSDICWRVYKWGNTTVCIEKHEEAVIAFRDAGFELYEPTEEEGRLWAEAGKSIREKWLEETPGGREVYDLLMSYKPLSFK